MLFNLYLVRIKFLLCFFISFHAIFNTFFIIPVVRENKRLKHALAIPTGTLITLVKEITDFTPLVADKNIELYRDN